MGLGLRLRILVQQVPDIREGRLVVGLALQHEGSRTVQHPFRAGFRTSSTA